MPEFMHHWNQSKSDSCGIHIGERTVSAAFYFRISCRVRCRCGKSPKIGPSEVIANAQNVILSVLFALEWPMWGIRYIKNTINRFRNEVLGKRVMLFKVCSCPKRDMQRDDTTLMPRKREASSAAPYGKRPNKMTSMTALSGEIKTEPPSTPCPSNSFAEPLSEIPHTVTLTMPSKESMQHVLRCAYNEVTGLMASKADESNHLLVFAKKIEGLLGEFIGSWY